MLKATKRTLTTAAMIAAASAPATASARLNLNPEPSTAHHRVQTLAPARPASPASPVTQAASASASAGFEWGDAGLGAAGILVLLGTGAGSAAVITRRRGHQARTS